MARRKPDWNLPATAAVHIFRMRWIDQLLRPPLTGLHQLLKLNWLMRRPRTFGAHALALTPEGRIILVKLRYAPGWRLPGGGLWTGEEPREAVLRELCEEIGMTGHGRVRLGCELDERVDFKRDFAALFIVEDVRYAPKWSWEVEQVTEASLDSLPNNMSARALRWIEALRGSI